MSTLFNFYLIRHLKSVKSMFTIVKKTNLHRQQKNLIVNKPNIYIYIVSTPYINPT